MVRLCQACSASVGAYCAFHVGVSITLEGKTDYTRLANCWTFIVQTWVGWQLPAFFNQPKNELLMTSFVKYARKRPCKLAPGGMKFVWRATRARL
jgi:hypothetical protein